MPARLCQTLAPILMSLGLTLPLHGESQATDNAVKLVTWQAASLLNPYLFNATKDVRATSLILEPLASYDAQGQLQPRLAASIPTVGSGDLDPNLRHITWTLKPSLTWSDGTRVTIEDVIFSAQFCLRLKEKCAAWSRFADVQSVQAIGTDQIRITFSKRQAYPYKAFVTSRSPILQRQQFEHCVSNDPSTCYHESIRPIGTGPFQIVEFRPNSFARFEPNPRYRQSVSHNIPDIVLEGSSNSETATRSVLETQAFDVAFNVQVASQKLAEIEATSKGRIVESPTGYTQRLAFNMAEPPTNWPDEYYSEPLTPHPILSDDRLRQALTLALPDFKADDAKRYGGVPSCSLLPLEPPNATCPSRDVVKANALLDAAGWTVGANGIRQKEGRRLHLVFVFLDQTLNKALYKEIQAAWRKIGVETGANPFRIVFYFANPRPQANMYTFLGDVGLFADGPQSPDAEDWLSRRRCDARPKRTNGFIETGTNIPRYCAKRFDRLHNRMRKTVNPRARILLAREMDRMLIDDFVEIPLFRRTSKIAIGPEMRGVRPNPWDTDLWNFPQWDKIERQ